MIFRTIRRVLRRQPKAATGWDAMMLDQSIIDAFEPWSLACAVGCDNGTIGALYGFEMWRRQSQPNWMPEVKQRVDDKVSEEQIIRVLEYFVACNRVKHWRVVFAEENERRGIPDPIVIEPGNFRCVAP
jgi:hypothetical protein